MDDHANQMDDRDPISIIMMLGLWALPGVITLIGWRTELRQHVRRYAGQRSSQLMPVAKVMV